MTESSAGRQKHLSDIPGAVVTLAQNDLEFAVKLLHRDSRDDALNDSRLALTERERSDLSARLDEVADMSFAEAMERIRDAGVLCLG